MAFTNKLDIEINDVGESFYNDKIQPLITELEEKGIIGKVQVVIFS